MQFRLGSFFVKPAGSSAREIARLHLEARLLAARAHRISPASESQDVRRALEEVLGEVRRRQSESMRDPCLLESLPPDSPERAWLGETLDAMQEAASERACIALEACEAEAGPRRPIVVAFSARDISTDVRPGDSVCAGVALRADADGGLELSPRVYRVACANGIVFESGTLAMREVEPGAIHVSVRELLGRRVFEREVEPLRAAAGLAADGAMAERSFVEVAGRLVDAEALHAIMRLAQLREEFARAGDRTAWGLANAITAVARNQRDWSRRLDEEREAGGVLARLLARPPQRPVGLALEPPRAAEHIAAHA